jgi:hypothetical protein
MKQWACLWKVRVLMITATVILLPTPSWSSHLPPDVIPFFRGEAFGPKDCRMTATLSFQNTFPLGILNHLFEELTKGEGGKLNPENESKDPRTLQPLPLEGDALNGMCKSALNSVDGVLKLDAATANTWLKKLKELGIGTSNNDTASTKIDLNEREWGFFLRLAYKDASKRASCGYACPATPAYLFAPRPPTAQALNCKNCRGFLPETTCIDGTAPAYECSELW